MHLQGTGELTQLMHALLERQAEIGARLDQMLTTLDAHLARMAAPKRVIRDADGEVIGVEVVTVDELRAHASAGSDLQVDDSPLLRPEQS